MKGARFYISPGEPITSGGSSYSAVPLLVEFSIRFWFTIDLAFKTRSGSLVLDNVGILVLAGTLANDAREVFRAEWEADESPHAQPHWHVYGSQLAEAFSIGSNEPDLKLPTNRVHFAMSARWMDEDDHDGTHHNIATSADGVKRWIAATLTYSKKQLEYVGRHVAKAGAAPTFSL
ncbi:MAG TPA: hypothetical protein VGQ36_16195 [Thermoanaerobaculia bacterium]|jgi:hypothetical protein|nr:hypothetical protein [Thermoanaerobaculia bacterium]